MSTYITIQTFTYPHEANIAKAKLEAEGIDAFLQDEVTTQVINLYSNAIGGVKLQVLEENIVEARKILIEGGFIVEDKTKLNSTIEVLKDTGTIDKKICPFCKSDNIDTVVNPNILVVLFYFIIGVILPIFKSWEKCYDCEKQWKYKKLKKEVN